MKRRTIFDCSNGGRRRAWCSCSLHACVSCMLRKVAAQIARATTNKAADAALTRAYSSMMNKMAKAGFLKEVSLKAYDEFVRVIRNECVRIGSQWIPRLPEDHSHVSNHGGGDAA